MTTIEFGGGPSLEARRQFSNLKPGSQLPKNIDNAKYTGHIHQLRYRFGRTYGDETHRLAKEYSSLKRSVSDVPTIKNDQSDPYETRQFSDGMLPGYTGYIPQRKYQLGNRYRVEADVCLAATKSVYEHSKNQGRELRRIIAAYPKTQSVNNDTVVKHFLDYHRAYNPTEGSQQSDHRPFIEPPIPGYRGYIPRIRPTDLNLGLRYHEAAKKGLNRFAVESTHLTSNFPTTTDVTKEINQSTDLSAVCFCRLSLSPSSTGNVPQRAVTSFSEHRIYPRSGMIPKYTGYLPQRKYHIGQTYGDTSRDLPVCSHPYANFGEYVRSKTSIGVSTTDVHQ